MRVALIVAIITVGYVAFLAVHTLSGPRPKARKEAYILNATVDSDGDVAAYKGLLPQLLSMPAPHYVLFTSGYFPGTDVPWCGDCAVNLPIIRAIVGNAGGSLLEVQAGSKNEWRSRSHPLRTDPDAPIAYLPTLYHWSSSGGPSSHISRALSSDESVEELRLVVAKFIRDTAAGIRRVEEVTSKVIRSGGRGCGGQLGGC
mmetsp:Transcript_16147/g.34964  ORF Transcript_16147/g.34964 Transcript_16147/m.34964 type:complete len:201 (+) Transcript_16147:174-776(+)|eukprot:CAMPEP_0202896614 /NCGR_PEP_ID=MMETSP1392-20130828/5584_1 /ASSEMBLY_ACC=CAM_ASM_000868 /TAXON_ID=225041 /ORGANISM="Chlamydomonas chlamydogama, Strain SAG 11-48b" /LENGTH=200 /DNA_ID=CAMNT_0049582033 /DNA_START=120 /DNA_END=722 /DNA_ORIENTATION=-